MDLIQYATEYVDYEGKVLVVLVHAHLSGKKESVAQAVGSVRDNIEKTVQVLATEKSKLETKANEKVATVTTTLTDNLNRLAPIRLAIGTFTINHSCAHSA